MFDPDLHLATLIDTHPRLLFYPDGGDNPLSCVLAMPYDVFVFSDHSPRTQSSRSNSWHKIQSEACNHSIRLSLVHSTVRTRVFRFDSKWGFLFFQDRDEVLDRIDRSPFTISAYVGISDGCTEREDRECVNEPPFLGKVLLASMPVMDYFTDHSPLLEDPEQSRRLGHRRFQKSIPFEIQANASFEFYLQNILYCFNDYNYESPNNYCTLISTHYRTHHARPYTYRRENRDLIHNYSPLWKLLRFRTERNVGIIAQYLVRTLGRKSASDLASEVLNA